MVAESAAETGTWIPLESNPDIFNAWAKALGLADTYNFEDIYGFDSDLLDMVTKPVKAILCIFPINENLENSRKGEDAKIREKGQPELDNTLMFIEQHIDNACGTIGLLHALANASLTIDPTSALSKFLEECKPLTPSARADLLASTKVFSEAHVAAATSAESSSVIPQDLNTNLHFITFVEAPSAVDPERKRIIELDGRRPGPVDQGPCTDLLADVAKIVKEKYVSLTTSMQFGLVALCGEPKKA